MGPFFLPLLLVGSLFIAGHALAQPVIITMPPPAVSYTPELPAALYFKEIIATRVSQNKIDIDITLQGDIPSRMPHGMGINYRIFFDIEGYEVENENPLLKLDDFVEDQYITISRNPGVSDFAVRTRDLITYRSKLWETKITKVRTHKDKVSFSVKSDLFSEPKLKIRAIATSLVEKTVDRVTSSGKKIAVDSVQQSPIFELPTKAQKSQAGGILEN